MEESFKDMLFFWVLLICLGSKFTKPQDVYVFIVCFFEFLITRYLIVENLIVVSEAWQNNCIWEKSIEIDHLLSNLWPHLMPVIYLAVYRREPMPHKISQKKNYIDFLASLQGTLPKLSLLPCLCSLFLVKHMSNLGIRMVLII